MSNGIETLDVLMWKTILEVVRNGCAETFADGYLSVMAQNLNLLASVHGDVPAFVRITDRVLYQEGICAAAKSEALKILASMCEYEAEPARDACIEVLRKRLLSCDAVLRDGVLVAFDILEDHRTISILVEHAKREPIASLRDYARGIVRSWR